MDELEDLQMNRTGIYFYIFTTMEVESKGWGSRKASLSSPAQHTHTNTRAFRVIHYWQFRGGNFIVVLFVQCYVVFYFLLLFCSFQFTAMLLLLRRITDHSRTKDFSQTIWLL